MGILKYEGQIKVIYFLRGGDGSLDGLCACEGKSSSYMVIPNFEHIKEQLETRHLQRVHVSKKS